jgi:hypothetical protein
VEEALRRSAEGETVVFADLADASLSKPQASGSVPDLFGRTKINPAWAD